MRQFAVEDELTFEEYRDSVLTTLNAVRGPGERSTERIDFTPGFGPGPMSVLGMLRDAGASESVRVTWTNELLAHGDADWVGEDLDTGRTFSVVSPARWAVESAGLVKTTRGNRQPSAAVSASMVKYEAFLPLFRGPAQVADALRLAERSGERACRRPSRGSRRRHLPHHAHRRNSGGVLARGMSACLSRWSQAPTDPGTGTARRGVSGSQRRVSGNNG